MFEEYFRDEPAPFQEPDYDSPPFVMDPNSVVVPESAPEASFPQASGDASAGSGMSTMDDILNVISIVSPTTAFSQGRKAEGTFKAVDEAMEKSGAGEIVEGLSSLPLIGKGFELAGAGYKLSKGASKAGGYVSDLFADLF